MFLFVYELSVFRSLVNYALLSLCKPTSLCRPTVKESQNASVQWKNENEEYSVEISKRSCCFFFNVRVEVAIFRCSLREIGWTTKSIIEPTLLSLVDYELPSVLLDKFTALRSSVVARLAMRDLHDAFERVKENEDFEIIRFLMLGLVFFRYK